MSSHVPAGVGVKAMSSHLLAGMGVEAGCWELHAPVIELLVEAFVGQRQVDVGQQELQHVVRVADGFILKLRHLHRVSRHHHLQHNSVM